MTITLYSLVNSGRGEGLHGNFTGVAYLPPKTVNEKELLQMTTVNRYNQIDDGGSALESNPGAY